MADAVESANVVGYQQMEATGGFNFTVPTFNPMGENIDIQDIQLVFAEGVTATGGDNLQILDDGGATVETYNWMPKEWMYPVPAKDGWADPMTGGFATKNITAGQGFLVNIAVAGTEIVLPAGYTPAAQ